eukprot:CAMPEP_0172745948 /NCGR_PEP_ID=MMETSP1074-20121228/139234_1 /TAXON_ID=2916 /ORGANISM="Ceratium fusus, Strain PA161109" /LENGTH=266 /DNA_ID=CAMNT_0013577215 /DNA_START=396 /DNA_END=1196 /DNA_ORIENTATION=+
MAANITKKRIGGPKVEQLRRMASATKISSSGPRSSSKVGGATICQQPSAKTAARSRRATGVGQTVAAVADARSRSQRNSQCRATASDPFDVKMTQHRHGAATKSPNVFQRPSPAGCSKTAVVPPTASNVTKCGVAQRSNIFEAVSKTAWSTVRDRQEEVIGSPARQAESAIISTARPRAGSSKPREFGDREPMVAPSATSMVLSATTDTPEASLPQVSQQWHCMRCTLKNPENTMVCKACGSPCNFGKDGRWMGKLCAARGVIDLT